MLKGEIVSAAEAVNRYRNYCQWSEWWLISSWWTHLSKVHRRCNIDRLRLKQVKLEWKTYNIPVEQEQQAQLLLRKSRSYGLVWNSCGDVENSAQFTCSQYGFNLFSTFSRWQNVQEVGIGEIEGYGRSMWLKMVNKMVLLGGISYCLVHILLLQDVIIIYIHHKDKAQRVTDGQTNITIG